ncbi:MAG TPA: ATP-grasp domain-containing protein [Syntrophorhabdaceae bacterium]|jgi:predicted ATP-grasp superfamily ATP-dependent carboligase
MKILVTNANSRMACSIARSMARNGHSVIAADYVPKAMTFFSRYISDRFLYPSPYSKPADFVRHLTMRIIRDGVDFLIPTHEETFLIAKHAHMFNKITLMTVPDYSAVLEVHNKDRLYSHLQNLSILTPKTIPLSGCSDFSELRNILPGKALLKPRQGGGNWGIKYLDRSSDYEVQIKNYLTSNAIARERVLIQEWVPILKKYSHVVIYQKGKLIQDFADIHLRDYPYAGGAGSLRISCDPGPMREISKRLFDSLGWHGVAEVEYVTHRETGDFYMIEVNPRIWGGLNSAMSSGLNIPDMLLRIAKGKEAMKPVEYTRGVVTRWFWGDLRVFPEYLRQSPSKLGALGEYMKLMVNGATTDEFRWDDPLPFFVWPAHALFKSIRYRSLRPVAYDSLGGEWE